MYHPRKLKRPRRTYLNLLLHSLSGSLGLLPMEEYHAAMGILDSWIFHAKLLLKGVVVTGTAFEFTEQFLIGLKRRHTFHSVFFFGA